MKRQRLIPAMCAILIGCGDDGSDSDDAEEVSCPASAEDAVIPLKEAKLNIEHNATDEDTGFQGAIDSEGWACLDVIGPDGPVLHLQAQGTIGSLGMTELFFETVEPENADVPIDDMLAMLPAGDYTIEGQALELGEDMGTTRGTALLTHDIPAGPVLVAPAEGAVVPVGELSVEWQPVTETIDGDDVTIISYQLIIEKDEEPDQHMIGKRGLSMYLGPTVNAIVVGAGFLEPGTAYAWEVLAIEDSGNQTLSSGTFETE